MGEEERRRKIIADSAVIRAANMGIHLAATGKLTAEQARVLTQLDAAYLQSTAAVLAGVAGAGAGQGVEAFHLTAEEEEALAAAE